MAPAERSAQTDTQQRPFNSTSSPSHSVSSSSSSSSSSQSSSSQTKDSTYSLDAIKGANNHTLDRAASSLASDKLDSAKEGPELLNKGERPSKTNWFNKMSPAVEGENKSERLVDDNGNWQKKKQSNLANKMPAPSSIDACNSDLRYTSSPDELESGRNSREGLICGSSLCPSPLSMNSATDCNHSGLLYYNREPLKLKDFSAEVRAPMDVEQFAHQAELMLDLNEVSMEGIIDAMLRKVAENEQIGDKLKQIRDSIFIPGPSMLMARTIQGFNSVAEYEECCRLPTKTSLKHDQSWLCALANLAQVTKRHMVIARFRNPVNMGENAHEVRLFVLIVVPTIEKSTKDQVETGRTFATMLTDAEFRQKLFNAANENEFKSLMLLRARELARAEKLKNRHKYLLAAPLHSSLSSLNNLTATTGDNQCSKSSATIENKSVYVGAGGAGGGSYKQTFNKTDFKVFGENPRTSTLFELISSTQTAGQADANQLKQRPIPHMTTSAINGDVGFIEFMGSQLPSANGDQKDNEVMMMKKKVKKQQQQQQPRKDSSGGGGGGCCCFLWNNLEFGKGVWQDFVRRIRFYPSDFRDAFVGPPRTIQKTVATIWFLYFGILLPTIAFSSLNTTQTHGHMGDLRKAIIGQAIGGLVFALLGGQPLVIIMTTAPLCLYTKVVHQMCQDYGFHFPAMYAAVGLWNGFFLIIYSLFGFSKLMKWCTRSTEEIFALFIVVAFLTDASKDMIKNFQRFYFTPACKAQNNHTSSVLTDVTQTMLTRSQYLLDSTNHSSHDSFRDIEDEIESSVCRRETSLLFVLLMLGTLWLSVTLYKFKKTPYLSAGKRDMLADYALPTAVILMSLVGSTIFDDIYVEKFPPVVDIHFERARVEYLPWTGLLTSMGLGFTLSLLFFMDQNISAAMVGAPQNRLKKGNAYHYDLLVVGLLNGCLTLYGLPMMHGVLPHSPLHARSLADIEEQVEEGHLRQVVVNSRETRVTAIVAHILVLGSLFLIPYPIAYIPRAVLNGLFLFMAITSLDGLQIFERLLLLATEQSKYPPNHYIRRCPQKKIHTFTLIQLAQLVVMCLFGFSPVNIIEMFFPVIILLMIPFRHKIVPKYIDEKYLDALDGKH